MNITIHRKCRDIDGALLVRMLARKKEMEAKGSLLADQVVEGLPGVLERAGKYLVLAIASVFGAVVVVQVAKLVLQ